jgi:CheY-like chemotaxis protein
MFQTDLPMFSAKDTQMTTDHASAQHATDGAPPCRAVILLVEDDPSVRSVVTRLLALQNYRLLSAESGAAALLLWEQHCHEIDLLLTDVMMPEGVNGKDLAIRCRSQNPRLKVIFTSGYDIESSITDGRRREGVRFLPKPFRPEQLMQLVETVLASSPEVKDETYAANSPR